jgi:hypothetical protein
MNTPPNMPQFGQQPYIAGQHHEQVKAAVQGGIGQMAMTFYHQRVSQYLDSLDGPVDKDKLRQFARDALAAGKCYFEGIGAIEQEESE